MKSGLNRTALRVFAAAVVAGSLISCSSSTDGNPSDADTAASETSTATSSASTPTSASADDGEPASSADQNAMAAVFERYVDTSNNGESQAYLDTVCSTDPVHSQGITDQGPAPYPVTVVDMKDFTVDGDTGLATVTVNIDGEDTPDELTSRFTFVRESGAWTVCGEKED